MSRGSQDRGHEVGFSLIEALVALAVIAVAASGIIRATEAHVDTIRNLELRTGAQWVAENRLAELALAGEDRSRLPGSAVMLGQRWQVSTQLAASDDPDLRLATVAVRKLGDPAPLVTLRGFVDAGTVSQ